MKNRILYYLILLTLGTFLLANTGYAQEREHKVTRLANPRTIFLKAMKTPDDVRRIFADQKYQRDIEIVLQKAGWSGSAADLFRAAETGEIGETSIAPGTQIPFLSLRRNGKPDIVRNVVWAGKAPFDAYTLQVESNGRRYLFYLPKPCGNLWFEDRGEIEVPPPPPPVVEEPPPPPVVEPPPPEAPEPAPEIEAEGPGLFFLGGFIGKERRTIFNVTPIEFADCVTILGVKAGVLPRIGENLEAELAVGAKFVIGDDDSGGLAFIDEELHLDHALFADVAIHALFDRGFFGGGVSFWDLTNSENRALALLIQMGLGGEKVQFSVEGRAPFEDLDNLGNNYMFWAGVRIRP